MFARLSRRLVAWGIFCLLIGVLAQVAVAERPSAPDLLPKETLVYLRIRDTQELVKSFDETALGQISREDKIRPLIADLYGSAAEAFTQVEDEVGVSLDKILEIPQGEIVVALVAQRTGPPRFVALIDVGDKLASAEKLIESGEKALAQSGAVRTTEQYDETELIMHAANEDEPLVHFIKESTIVITNSADVSKQILDVWNGKMEEPTETVAKGDDEEVEVAFEPLIKNQQFVAIMRRCRGTKEDPAQFTFFVDPISLYRVSSRGNAGAQVGLAVLPVLGLDGFEALGGSVTFAADDFDMITHLHVKLSEPRTGVIEMLALKAEDSTPERWVPADAGSYTTIHWDADKTYSTLGELYDSFRGEDRLAADVKENISEEIGIDFETEVIENFGGRLTYITWYERPARIGSEAAMIGVRLKDAKAFRPTLEKLTDKFGDNLEKKSFGGVTYWEMKRADLPPAPAEDAGDAGDVSDEEAAQRRRAARRRQRQETFRTLRPSPCFAVLDDYLIAADRTSFLKKVILTNGDSSQSLAKELDFKLIAGKIRRQVGGAKPGMITFSRPEEGFKVLYEMATGADTRQRLSGAAEDNEFFGALNGALERNELPPFSVLAQYLAPAGGMLVSDETGLHYTGFVLKRK